MPVRQLIEYYPDIVKLLLRDNTTGKNIIFATKNYDSKSFSDEIIIDFLKANPDAIKPRYTKNTEDQKKRTQNKAEVFTPIWVIEKMNNLIDNNWFGVDLPDDKSVFSSKDKIDFSSYGKSFMEYLKMTWLEITCGEAPYVTSRYDAATGKPILVPNRVGFLDRKLRVITENTDDKAMWIAYADIALKTCFGYEYQGDSLLIARANILTTISDHYAYKFREQLSKEDFAIFAYYICNNFIQMDGLTRCIPCENPYDYKLWDGKTDKERQKNLSKIEQYVAENGMIWSCFFDWSSGGLVRFRDLERNKLENLN